MIGMVRQEVDIAARRARETARQVAADASVLAVASTRHTLATSSRLSCTQRLKALRAAFGEADCEEKGALTYRQLVRSLRQLRVLGRVEPMARVLAASSSSSGNGTPPKSKQEAHVLQLLGHLFDYGPSATGAIGDDVMRKESGKWLLSTPPKSALIDFDCYEQLLTRILYPAQAGAPAEGGLPEEQGRGGGSLELLPPEIGDQLVSELQALHVVNKHTFATGTGGAYKRLRKEAVEAARSDTTFAPTINVRSRQLERHSRHRSGTVQHGNLVITVAE